MRKNRVSVDFNLKFENITDLNPSFAAADVAIAYAGRNRNISCISKDVFDKAIPSLKNCPLVGRYDADKDDFGSHDIRVTKNANGEFIIANATVPFGVIPESSNIRWETVTEEDGTQREYLYCTVILWKRQYGYDCLAKQDTWNQSMEIEVNSYVIDQDGYCVIEDMIFEALCILGNGVEPCFESASVQMTSAPAVADYREQFSAMLQEFRAFTTDNPVLFNLGMANNHEEGKNNLDKEKMLEILAEFGLTMDTIPFESADDMDEATFRAKLNEVKAGKPMPESFSATYRQKREAIANALDSVVVKDSNGNVVSETYYWVDDFDDTYAYVEKYTWTVNDSNQEYGRMGYTFDQTALTATVTNTFEKMVRQWLTMEENEKLQQSRNAFEVLTQEFEGYKKDYSVKNDEVEELRSFKQNALKQNHAAEMDAVLAEFEEQLGTNEEFSALKDRAYEFDTADSLRKECFVIVGKSAVGNNKFSKKPSTGAVKVPLSTDTKGADVVYAELFERFCV